MTTGRDLCEMFKDRACDRVGTVEVAWPDNPVRMGRAVEITYRSDKWSADARGHKPHRDYYHPFETDVAVIADARCRLSRGPMVPVRMVRRCPTRAVATLADVLELRVEDDAGEELVIEIERGPNLGDSSPLHATCHRGRDMLIVALPLPDGALLLYGGGLEIRPEGIVG